MPRATNRRTGTPVMSDAAVDPAPDMLLFDLPADRPRVAPDPRSDAAEMSVAVVGLGYVGLPTALALREKGVRVIGLEISTSRIAAIRAGSVDLIEDDHARLGRALGSTDFVLTSDPTALRGASAVIVCVPTPVDEYRSPDLTALKGACETVVANAVPGQLVILTSTSYVGCTRDLVVTPLEERGFVVGEDVFVAYSPERIDPGNTLHPQDRVPRVLGGMTPACTRRAEAVIGTIAPVHLVSSPEAAELTKLYENTFRAVNIALANEMEGISQVLGLDISEVIDAASSKPFGFMPFRPGTGVGGHCIPCDPHYLLWQLRAERHTAPVIEQAMADIASRPYEIVDRVTSMLSDAGRGTRGARILVVGVAYKPGVEDVRESPALEIIEELITRGADVAFADPLIPSIRLHDGRVLHATSQAMAGAWDLVLVHVLQPGFDATWLLDAPLLLDPGDQLRHLRHERFAEPIELAVLQPVGTEPEPAPERRNGHRSHGELAPTGTVGA